MDQEVNLHNIIYTLFYWNQGAGQPYPREIKSGSILFGETGVLQQRHV